MGFGTRFSAKKKPLTASISCSKIKHPLSLSSLSSFLLFFFSKFLQLLFLLETEPKQFFFMTQSLKDTRNKNNNKNTNVTRTRTKQRHKQQRNKTQTRKQITEQGQNNTSQQEKRVRNKHA